MAVKSEKVTFSGAGGDQLAARLDLPQGKPRAFALFAHCFTCNKDIFAAARIAAGPHRLRADEPESAGGFDSGPSPYDFLLAGLGACTSMTLRLYAERKGLDLKRTRVTLSHEKIHAQDCADCETKDGRIDRIERMIALEGDLTAAERQRLLEIADKCPVHRTLESEVLIATSLRE